MPFAARFVMPLLDFQLPPPLFVFRHFIDVIYPMLFLPPRHIFRRSYDFRCCQDAFAYVVAIDTI